MGADARFESDYFVVDSDFGKLFNLEITHGRDFSEERDGNKNSKAFILNERAVEELDSSTGKIVGKRLDDPDWNASGQVVGVAKNFHYRSLHSEIAPLVIKMDPKFVRFLSVRVQSQNLNEHLLFLEDVWNALFSNSPFYYTFLDDELGRLYASEERVAQLFNLFTAIAIAISCLGLLGLAAFAAEQRTKEIGIRKVLGATVANVATLLTKDFIKLVLIANILAWPLAWLAINKWLQNFAYRIEISWWVFALAGGLALVIALLTVSTQAMRAALANPVESLRYD
ncbi:MAG: ABC transporter permease [bacterium]